MQNSIDSFAEAVRVERAWRRLTRKQLAELLHLSERTLMDVELVRTNSRLETVAIIAQGLDISLDAIVSPNTQREYLPKSVSDFLWGNLRARYRSTFRCAGMLNQCWRTKRT